MTILNMQDKLVLCSIQLLLDVVYAISHPQSMVPEKELIEGLKAKFPASENLEWNFDNDNFDVLNWSDILISDYSGVMFDFTLVFDRSIIYADVSFDKGYYDASWLDKELWTLTVLPRLGKQLTAENAGNIKALIDECLSSREFAEGREQARKETWAHIGESIRRTADYLIGKERVIKGESSSGCEEFGKKQGISRLSGREDPEKNAAN